MLCFQSQPSQDPFAKGLLETPPQYALDFSGLGGNLLNL